MRTNKGNDKQKVKNDPNIKSEPSKSENFSSKLYENLVNAKKQNQSSPLYDSTSLVELTVIKEKFDPLIKPDKVVSDKVDKFIQSIEKQEIEPNGIEDSIQLLKDYYIELNNSEKALNSGLTGYMVKMGMLIIGIQKMAYALHYKWEDWADANLHFINKRTRQTYMKLAKIKNVEKYLMLRKERILHIDSVIKDIIEKDDADPIGTFFKQHNINFESAADKPFEEFKSTVDAAVVIEKAKKKGLGLNRQLVRGLIEIGFKFTNSDFNQLKEIKESGGEPDKSLEKLLMHKGKRSIESDGKDKKRENFIRASFQMKDLVDHMIENKNYDDIDPNDVGVLIEKLKRFQEEIKNK